MLNIALADDRIDGLKKLVHFLENKPGVKLSIKAVTGYDLIVQMHLQEELPDIIFIDINMPVMDGMATTYFLKFHYPSIKVIGLSIYDDVRSIKHIIECGAAGYLLKADTELIVDEAISHVMKGEKYIDERIGLDTTEKDIIFTIPQEDENQIFGLTQRERTFIILNGTTLTYEQIAQIMFVETKTIQTYFDRVSKKLNVTSRQALTIFSFQNGLAKVALLTKQPNLR